MFGFNIIYIYFRFYFQFTLTLLLFKGKFCNCTHLFMKIYKDNQLNYDVNCLLTTGVWICLVAAFSFTNTISGAYRPQWVRFGWSNLTLIAVLYYL